MPLDSRGIWIYDEGETLPEHISDWLNRLAQSTSDALNLRPKGEIGYAERTANQGSIVAETSLTGLTLTIGTASAGRKLMFTAAVQLYSTVAGDDAVLSLRRNGVEIATHELTLAKANTQLAFRIARRWAHTGTAVYSLGARRATGTGTITMRALSTTPAFLLAEDIGAS